MWVTGFCFKKKVGEKDPRGTWISEQGINSLVFSDSMIFTPKIWQKKSDNMLSKVEGNERPRVA